MRASARIAVYNRTDATKVSFNRPTACLYIAIDRHCPVCRHLLWFAGNAILADIPALASRPEAIGQMTSAVQIGFIIGTLVFALLSITDRFSPSKVFLTLLLLGSRQ